MADALGITLDRCRVPLIQLAEIWSLGKFPSPCDFDLKEQLSLIRNVGSDRKHISGLGINF